MSLAEHAAANANQGSLFDVFEAAAAPTVEHIIVPAWDDKTRLAEEKPAIGFYLSGHPFDAYAKDVKAFIKTRLDRLQPRKDIQYVAGIVIGVRVKNGERGRMAFVTLDDGWAKQDITVYSEVFEANRTKLTEDALLVIPGKISEDRFSGGVRVIADGVMDIAEARSQFAQALTLKFNGNADAAKLRQTLDNWSGGACQVEVEYHNDNARCKLALGYAWRVTLHDDLVSNLKTWLGDDAVAIRFAAQH
jgi:DNA polymerase III subunit alpha